MRVVIRDLTDADVEAVAEVFRASSLSNERDRPLLEAHPELLVWAPHPNRMARTRVATTDTGVVGFATTAPTLDGLELEDLFVIPGGMRRGVGRALVEDAVAHARSCGAPGIDVDANDHALAFYERCGFVITGRAALRFGTAPRMRLRLDPPVASPG